MRSKNMRKENGPKAYGVGGQKGIIWLYGKIKDTF